MGQTVLISLRAHETMLLRSAANTLRAEGVCPMYLNDLTFDIRSVNFDPVARESVENILHEAARFSSGIWSFHYENMAERIRTFEHPKSDVGLVSVPLGYEPDPSKTLKAITSDHANVEIQSLAEQTQSWRDGLLKSRFWMNATAHLLNSVYIPLFGSLRTRADLMTMGAVSVYARALLENVDVISAFCLMKGSSGKPNKGFTKLTESVSLIHGMQLFNASLERLYSEVFKGSASHASAAIMGDEIGESELKEWAFGHRLNGFYTSTFHGELALRMLGSAEETFLRMEREGDVGGCMQVLQYLRDQVTLSETDYIAQHASFSLIADLAIRTAAITSDDAVDMTLEEWRVEAEGALVQLESDLSPFPQDYWSRRRSRGGTVESISSASGWRGPSGHGGDDPPSMA